MKKLLSILLMAIMVCAMCTTAFAANITVESAQNGNTLVEYGVEVGYTVTIPDAVTIESYAVPGVATVSVSNAMLASQTYLKVTIDGIEELVDATNAESTLAYTVSNSEGALNNRDTVLSVEAGAHWNDTVSSELTFALVDEPTVAGDFSDIITFAVSIKSTQPN